MSISITATQQVPISASHHHVIFASQTSRKTNKRKWQASHYTPIAERNYQEYLRIMRRSNCAGTLQYVPQPTWILFLRILDEREKREAE